jgi:hypothetical protein
VLALVSVDEARLLEVLGGNASCPDMDVMLELFLGYSGVVTRRLESKRINNTGSTALAAHATNVCTNNEERTSVGYFLSSSFSRTNQTVTTVVNDNESVVAHDRG